MVDGMGFSDLGYHGGETWTANIDSLAAAGVRFSQFYNSGCCCPTRASLLTGLHPHQPGIGHMTKTPNGPRKHESDAYQGFLNNRCVTIAEALGGGGYGSFMADKWHLGFHDQANWPLQRGFGKFYGCIAGATRFLHPEHPRGMTHGNKPIEKPKSTTRERFYTTDAFTDWGIRFIDEEQKEQKRPFFLHLAYTAPHWPLQAFKDDIARYRGKIQRRLGKTPPPALLAPDRARPDQARMETLRPAAKDPRLGFAQARQAGRNGPQDGRLRRHDRPHRPEHRQAQGLPEKARPARINPRKDWYREPACLPDIMATLLEVAGAKYPDQLPGNKPPALPGISLTPAFDAKPLGRTEPMFFEHETNAFIRDGKWKLVGRDLVRKNDVEAGKWELYDMESDRTETNGLSGKHPEKTKELADKWRARAKKSDVLPRG